MESKPSLQKKFDTSLNECLRLVSGCIKSTPTELLPILSEIDPVDIRRNKNILNLHIRPMENTHIFHQAAISPLTNARLNCRMPLSARMHCLSHDNDDKFPEDWTQHAWRRRWENSNCQLNNFIAYPSSKPPGYDLKRIQWVLLNRLRSGHGRYGSFMHRIGLCENANCICGAQQILKCCI